MSRIPFWIDRGLVLVWFQTFSGLASKTNFDMKSSTARADRDIDWAVFLSFRGKWKEMDVNGSSCLSNITFYWEENRLNPWWPVDWNVQKFNLFEFCEQNPAQFCEVKLHTLVQTKFLKTAMLNADKFVVIKVPISSVYCQTRKQIWFLNGVISFDIDVHFLALLNTRM